MGQHGQKGRSRFLKPPRFEHVFGELLRCARRSCAPRDLIGVAAPHHNTRPAPSHIPKPRLIVSTLAHSPALSNRTHIILSALRASLKFTARPPLAQGHDEPSMTERCEHFTSSLWSLPVQVRFKCGAWRHYAVRFSSPRLHGRAAIASSHHTRLQRRESLSSRPPVHLLTLVRFHRCSAGHGMRVHRRPQLLPGLFGLGCSRGACNSPRCPAAALCRRILCCQYMFGVRVCRSTP